MSRSVSAAELIYETESGQAWLGDAVATLGEVFEADSVDLIVTSPPYWTLKQYEKGNQAQLGDL